MGYQVVWWWQFSMVQGPNLCCGLYVYMILSHIPPIENFPMTLHEFLLCYCWVPALVNAFFPDTVYDVFPSLVNVFPESCRWCFPQVFSMSSQVIVIVSCHWCVLRMTFIKRHLHAGKWYKRDQGEGQQKLSCTSVILRRGVEIDITLVSLPVLYTNWVCYQ